VVEETDFSMAWIGYTVEDEAKKIRPVASAGFNDNYLDTINLSWDDNEFGRGPTGVAIRTGKVCICENMLTDPTFKPWREEALKRGYASSIVFPLFSGEKVFGAITIYSKEPDSFLEDEIKLLSKLASDLSYGITTIRLRLAHDQAEKALVRSHSELEATVKERTAELLTTYETLKQTEVKYRTVADFATNWEFWISPEDQMIYCSPSCERITGYSATEFVMNSHLIYSIIHPDDLHIFLEHKKKELVAEVCDHEIQYRIQKKDGSIRWIGHFCQPVFDEDGLFKGNRGSNKDITARKKMEELLTVSNQKYKLLSENINDGIFICKNGKFEYVNQAINDIFGYSGHELERMKLTQLVNTNYRDELEDFLYTNSSRNQSCNIEVECIRKDLSTVFVEILLNYVANDNTVYGVLHDITEKKEFQKNMVKAIIQTEEKERSHFSKELHDGLGPLLSTIKLYLQWSERPNSNKSREEIIGKAGEILEEALGTVKEISNKLSPHLLTNYGLNSAIRSFVDKLNATDKYNIELESDIDRRIDPEIEAALYRAMIECINNTLKYAHANNIYINMNDTGNQIQINYKDDGIGFDLVGTLAKHKGLGLFNLQNRLHTIGGKVDLISEPGEGVNYLFTVNI
jgi:PAS domain S-box-containing protein